VHQAIIGASVATDKPDYSNGEDVRIAVTFEDGGGPVEGADVRVVLTVPNGAALGGGSTTAADGVATISHTVDAGLGGADICGVETMSSRHRYETVTAEATFRVSG
jgi:hypothetical protein